MQRARPDRQLHSFRISGAPVITARELLRDRVFVMAPAHCGARNSNIFDRWNVADGTYVGINLWTHWLMSDNVYRQRQMFLGFWFQQQTSSCEHRSLFAVHLATYLGRRFSGWSPEVRSNETLGLSNIRHYLMSQYLQPFAIFFTITNIKQRLKRLLQAS